MSSPTFNGIDLHSDTQTRPTLEMKQAMLDAPLGDEQLGEDPTTAKLEEQMAKALGFSKAIFLPSATLANQIAIRLHCDPGDELISAKNCHLFFAEGGGFAANSSVVSKPIDAPTGIFTAKQLAAAINKHKSPYDSISKLVNIENTANLGGGFVWPKKQLEEVLEVAKGYHLRTHLDGSRLFNAVVASGRTAKELCFGFDSVTICLSKGLGCPTGAILAFDENHFDKVRRQKQMLGGSMRQSGMLAAAGIYALRHHIERLKTDHANANALFEGMNSIEGIAVEGRPESNMVFFALEQPDEKFLSRCMEEGFRFSEVGENRYRAVTHYDVSAKDIDTCVKQLKEMRLS